MIFVTVGAQMPFDRLIEAVDQWAGEAARSDVVAQIGPSRLTPSHLRVERFLAPEAYSDYCEQADLIVAHAGMGTIITALQLGKPLLVMPRLGNLHETRNDHQVATAERFEALGLVEAAYDVPTLHAKLNDLDRLRANHTIDGAAAPRLLETVRRFIDGQGTAAPPEAPTPISPARKDR